MNRLKEIRKEHKLSQVELSKILGIAQPTLSGWENNKFQIDDEGKIKLAQYFNITVDYLLGLEASPKATTDFTDAEIQLIKKTRALNAAGLEKVNAYIDGLLDASTSETKKLA